MKKKQADLKKKEKSHPQAQNYALIKLLLDATEKQSIAEINNMMNLTHTLI